LDACADQVSGDPPVFWTVKVISVVVWPKFRDVGDTPSFAGAGPGGGGVAGTCNDTETLADPPLDVSCTEPW
jgi:hypothetical protein